MNPSRDCAVNYAINTVVATPGERKKNCEETCVSDNVSRMVVFSLFIWSGPGHCSSGTPILNLKTLQAFLKI